MPKTTKKKVLKEKPFYDINKTKEQIDAIPNVLPTEDITIQELPNENNCEYHLTMHFNNEKFECFTNNIGVSILSFKPVTLSTEGFIKIEKGNAVWERKYPLIKLRQIFNDEQTMELFLNGILLG